MTLPTPKHSWNFNETSGTTAADSVGGAVVSLDRASWVPGRLGNAIRFNPTDGVKLATTSLPELPPPWTAGFWVKREADSEGSSLISSPSYALKLEQWGNTHEVGFTKFAENGKPGFDTPFNFTSPLGQWVHLALVGTATEVLLYVNGQRQGSVNEAINLGLQWLGSTKGYVEFASAVLDEIKIFDQALTDQQVAELMHEGDPPATPALSTIFPLAGTYTFMYGHPGQATPYQATVAVTSDTGGTMELPGWWSGGVAAAPIPFQILSPTQFHLGLPGTTGSIWTLSRNPDQLTHTPPVDGVSPFTKIS